MRPIPKIFQTEHSGQNILNRVDKPDDIVYCSTPMTASVTPSKALFPPMHRDRLKAMSKDTSDSPVSREHTPRRLFEQEQAASSNQDIKKSSMTYVTGRRSSSHQSPKTPSHANIHSFTAFYSTSSFSPKTPPPKATRFNYAPHGAPGDQDDLTLSPDSLTDKQNPTSRRRCASSHVVSQNIDTASLLSPAKIALQQRSLLNKNSANGNCKSLTPKTKTFPSLLFSVNNEEEKQSLKLNYSGYFLIFFTF
jgi:hypothetical protein